jgi:zinc D-Ala-D-Ala carboxypeptidase
MGDLSAHFSLSEFRCPCGCNQVVVHPALIETLEDIREFAGIPIQITSGYRCRAHNAAVGGKPNSAHLLGEAADFWVSGDKDRFKLLEAAFVYGPMRIGIGKEFIHVDVSHTLPSEVCWLYGAA